MGMSKVTFEPTTEMERHLTWLAALQLEVLQAMSRASPPAPAPGVYWLIDHQHEVIYVGQSSNVMRRLSAHRHIKHYRCMMIYEGDAGERFKLEGRLILVFKPRCNGNAGRRPRYDAEMKQIYASFPAEAFAPWACSTE